MKPYLRFLRNYLFVLSAFVGVKSHAQEKLIEGCRAQDRSDLFLYAEAVCDQPYCKSPDSKICFAMYRTGNSVTTLRGGDYNQKRPRMDGDVHPIDGQILYQPDFRYFTHFDMGAIETSIYAGLDQQVSKETPTFLGCGDTFMATYINGVRRDLFSSRKSADGSKCIVTGSTVASTRLRDMTATAHLAEMISFYNDGKFTSLKELSKNLGPGVGSSPQLFQFDVPWIYQLLPESSQGLLRLKTGLVSVRCSTGRCEFASLAEPAKTHVISGPQAKFFFDNEMKSVPVEEITGEKSARFHVRANKDDYRRTYIIDFYPESLLGDNKVR